jgi:hypothetical protein
MRMVIVWTVICAAPVGWAAERQSCRSLPDIVQEALRVQVAFAYGKSTASCDDALQGAQKRILQSGEAVLPCLRELLHGGLIGTGLWRFDEPTPTETRWVAGLIARIRPEEGLAAYRELLANAPTESFEHVSIEIEIAALGGQEVLPSLAVFLEHPPFVRKGLEEGLVTLQERVANMIARHNYKPGLSALKRWKALGTSYAELEVYIAQLAGDVARLRDQTRLARVHVAALQALRRVGRSDIVESLASDQSYPYQSAAQFVLAGGASTR